MPFIDLKTNVDINEKSELSLKSSFGEAIIALGKSEAYLMINLEGNKTMYFKGDDDDCAIVQIALFGKASSSQYDKMTEMVCKIVSNELGISPDRIYVKYEEVDHWGYSGFNF